MLMTTTITMPDFILYALVAGIGVAIVMGATGVFVVWRRMAYFGDTLAHSALLGVAIGFLLGINVNIGIVGVCLTIAIGMVYLRSQRHLAEDTLLGILAHSSLALGLVSVSFVSALRINLMTYLFGDILSVTPADIGWGYGGGTGAPGGLAPAGRDSAPRLARPVIRVGEAVRTIHTRSGVPPRVLRVPQQEVGSDADQRQFVTENDDSIRFLMKSWRLFDKFFV